ncbi:MAG: aromatic amino acid aminotransferase [Candidatus Omnitrophica bacterium 4484_70.1]|nr:MAG: aromatic amino acid aminotransferase [Candidatus Omnitrophica bacterium 4484_70.1]
MIAKRVERIPPSGIREFFDLVLGMPDVISLGVGEPDFVTSWRIREKAITALEEGYTSYTSNKGLKALREQICEYLRRKYFLDYDSEDEILITCGASEALDLALRAVLNPKDKVLIISPHYVAYPALVELNLGRIIYLPTKIEEGFKIEMEKLVRVVKKNSPKLVILNYPCNPTGVTYSRKELDSIWRVFSQNNIFVVSDEIYSEIVYEGKHIPFSSLKGAKKRTLLLNGFSKGYAMTGFRIGYACGPRKIIEAMTKIHSFSMLCAPIVSQIAGCQALKEEDTVEEMVKEYRRRRDFIVKELNRLGLKTLYPQGTFYCFSSIEKFGISSLEFARRLLFEEKVAVVPGKAFGDNYDRFLRISFANSLENLKEAIIRLERFLDRL